MTWTALFSHILFALILLGISICINRILISRVRIMDVPNVRSSHSKPVPKAGGLAIVATFLAGIAAIFFLGDKTPISMGYFRGFVCASLALALASFYDDINYKVFVFKLGTQILAALIVLYFGIVIDTISFPYVGRIDLGIWAYPLSFLWIVGLTNAYNFMDGLDGLAAGTAVIVCFFFGMITFQQGSTFVYITCYTVLAGTLGFLFYNFPPARIFMGDVGSAFLGFIFASLAIIAARYDHSHTSFFVIPLLLFHFIFDTTFTFFRRLLRGERVTQAHRTHLYQLMNQLGCSHLQVALFYYAVCILQGIGALFLVSIQGDKRVFVFLPYLIFQIIFTVFIVRMARGKALI